MNIVQLISGDLCRLSNIERYATHPHLHRESVAEHSFYVSLYAAFIAEDLNCKGIKVDLGRLLLKCAYHDLEECISGDIVRPFKHSSKVLKEAIDLAIKDCMDKVISDIYDADKVQTSDVYREWLHCKDFTIEGVLVSFCDLISVYSYAIREVRLGNRYSNTILNDCIGYIIDLVNSLYGDGDLIDVDFENRYELFIYFRDLVLSITRFTKSEFDGPLVSADDSGKLYLVHKVNAIPSSTLEYRSEK